MKDRQKEQSNKAILLQIINKIANLQVVNDDTVSRIIAKNPSVESLTFSKSQVLEAYYKYKKSIRLPSDKRSLFISIPVYEKSVK